ncbi:MAG: right-handed parallel beta-helix repeat-containing protein [Planctomycetota bacterium]|nr:right-handed parallel beta-helix repeat-containing protein [Planctomycetota bacterium]
MQLHVGHEVNIMALRRSLAGGWILVLALFVSGREAVAQKYVPDHGTFDKVVSGAASGETVIVRSGNHISSTTASLVGKTDVVIRGEVGSTIYAAAPTGTSAALRLTQCTRIKLDGLTFEGAFQSIRGVKIEPDCSFVALTGCEFRYFGHHAIDIDGSDNSITDCRSHHNLAFPEGVRVDAHGIVTLAAQRLAIKRCKSYCNSGDSFQADRGNWNNITIDDCDFWDEPIPNLTVSSQFAGKFPNPVLPVGKTSSENAIDTKHLTTSTGVLTLRDVRMYGFTMNADTAFNASALVLKEKVQVTALRCIVKDSEIGWRVRGWSNTMQCKLDMVNCWTENCPTGFRLEDAPNTAAQQIRLAHNTFKNCSDPAVMAPSSSGFYKNSTVVNCLVQGSALPLQFTKTLGNTNVPGAKGISVPSWAYTYAATDLLLKPRPRTAPTAGALQTYP